MSESEFRAAMELIKSSSKKAIFDTWFSRLELVSVADDIAVIGTPNRFVKEWIEESDLIHGLANALKSTYGRPMTPSLIITERASTNATLDSSRWLRREDSESLPRASSEPLIRPLSESNERPGSDLFPRPAPPPQAPPPPPIEEDRPDKHWSVPLKRDYVFENYVIGPSNRLAHAAALAVAQNPGTAYNPLFLHSASGLGKTHLLQAICSTLLMRPPRPQILYLSCEDFVNQFIEAVKDNALESFRGKLRFLDMLLIDDIHFLADKPRIQEEFFHTFNSLFNAQKQIVLSADCHPSEIPTLQERLVSRFNWGLVTRIDTPEFETRAAIIKKKSALKGAELDAEVVSLLASRITTNVREVEGALNRLIGTSHLLSRRIDAGFAVEVLADLLGEATQIVAMNDILEAVVEKLGVPLGDLKSKKRTRKIAHARQVCMFLAREMTDLTLQDIGRVFGGRDHTTVIYAIEKIEQGVKDDEELSELVQGVGRQARQRAATSAAMR
jgi:chromosomal replication initiator protein